MFEVVGTADLLWVSVGAVLASVVLNRHMGRLYADRLAEAPGEDAAEDSARPASKLSRYVYLVFAGTLAGDITHVFVDNARSTTRRKRASRDTGR